jgi:hypothetical protein
MLRVTSARLQANIQFATQTPINSQMDNHYCYSSLDQHYQNRLLQLIPGTYSSPLHGRLQHVDLVPSSPYEALSYESGSPQKEHTIFMENETQILITRSFYNALKISVTRNRLDSCGQMAYAYIPIDLERHTTETRGLDLHFLRGSVSILTCLFLFDLAPFYILVNLV